MKHRSAPKGPLKKAAQILSVGDREAIFIASTEAPDRHGDVLIQNWDFKDFKKNPILHFEHGQSLLPIGRVPKLWTEDKKTYARTEATPEGMDSFADKVWRFIKGGFLNAVSVGFLPVEEPEPRYNKDGDWLGWTYPKSALLELSVVAVPAQQEATVIARSLNIPEKDVFEVLEKPKGVQAGVRAARRYLEIQRLRVSN